MGSYGWIGCVLMLGFGDLKGIFDVSASLGDWGLGRGEEMMGVGRRDVFWRWDGMGGFGGGRGVGDGWRYGMYGVNRWRERQWTERGDG